MVFRRLWEAVAWNLNVRYNVDIQLIERSERGVRVQFSQVEQALHETSRHDETLEFDYLIIACPLSPQVIERFGFTNDETELFRKNVKSHSYCLSSFTTIEIEMREPIAATLPLPEIGMPWAITKQFGDSNLFQFYPRVPDKLHRLEKRNDEDLKNKTPLERSATNKNESLRKMTAKEREDQDPIRRLIVGNIRKTVKRLGGLVDEDQWYTYDRWSYFQHVTAEAMRYGFYQKLEALQGKNRTYYTGALLNFELVETSIAYSKHLVESRFKEKANSTDSRSQ